MEVNYCMAQKNLLNRFRIVLHKYSMKHAINPFQWIRRDQISTLVYYSQKIIISPRNKYFR